MISKHIYLLFSQSTEPQKAVFFGLLSLWKWNLEVYFQMILSWGHKFIHNNKKLVAEYLIWCFCLCVPRGFRFGEYDPYDRPKSNMGFVMDGQPVDEYGRPVDEYGRPYGQGEYMNGNIDDEYPYGYGYGGR